MNIARWSIPVFTWLALCASFGCTNNMTTFSPHGSMSVLDVSHDVRESVSEVVISEVKAGHESKRVIVDKGIVRNIVDLCSTPSKEAWPPEVPPPAGHFRHSIEFFDSDHHNVGRVKVWIERDWVSNGSMILAAPEGLTTLIQELQRSTNTSG